jgi:transmembrane sensor
MSEPATLRPRVEKEAADWFARLSRLSVSTDDLRRFRAWRQDPEHAAAYSRIETVWDKTGGLAADAEIVAATEAVLQRRRRREPRAGGLLLHGRALGGIAAAGLVVVAGAVLLVFNAPPTYATKVGERSVVTLDDGSRVQLNTDTRLAVRFSRGERRVELSRGEAFFEVAHDSARPFIVAADGARVRAVGTKFDVRRLNDGVQVTLVEGRVRVGPSAHPDAATLAPNQQLTVAAGAVTPPSPADAAAVSSWTAGRITFHATPLAVAVAEVNRYATRQVTLEASPALAQQPVTGVFDAGDTQAFASTVAAVLDLQSVGGPDGAITLRPRSGPAR